MCLLVLSDCLSVFSFHVFVCLSFRVEVGVCLFGEYLTDMMMNESRTNGSHPHPVMTTRGPIHSPRYLQTLKLIIGGFLPW